MNYKFGVELGTKKLIKMKTSRVILFMIAISLLSNCTIEKRQFMSGYYIQWNHGKKEKKENNNAQIPGAENENVAQIGSNLEINNTIVASANETQSIITKKESNGFNQNQKINNTSLNKSICIEKVFSKSHILKNINRPFKKATAGGTILIILGTIIWILGIVIILSGGLGWGWGIVLALSGSLFIFSGGHINKKNNEPIIQNAPTPSAPPTQNTNNSQQQNPAPAKSKTDRLRELKQMFDEKLIDKEDYENGKKKILDEKE